MSVELTPEELGFRRPFNHEVTQTLRIANRNAGPVAFKVKTTAPKQYCVRPNSGIVRPNDSVDVQVLLQGMKEDPPLDARCRDKFLVQSVQVDETDEANVASLWSAVEKTNKGSIQEKKIRVQFLPPVDSTHLNGGVSSDEPPAYTSPTPIYGSPAPESAREAKSPAGTSLYSQATTIAPPSHTTSNSVSGLNSGSTSGLTSNMTSNTTSNATSNNARETARDTADATGFSGAIAAVSNAVPKNQDELNQQLAAAQARIRDLTNQLSDPQVRQRKVAEAQEKVQTIVQQTQETGVPLHIVAALCLLSFLIAYLFF